MCSPACPIGIGSPCAVARPDPHRQFELVIEIAAGAVARRVLVRQLALAVRPAHRDVRFAHRRGPAVIGDRHVFVVRVQRVVRVAAAPAIRGVVDAGEKIGEVADRRRQVQPAIGGAVQQPVGERLGPAAGPSVASSAKTCRRKARRGSGAERHQRVQRAARGGRGGALRLAREQPGIERGAQVEDHVADRDAAARAFVGHGAAARAEHAERQVLQRELRHGRWPNRPSSGARDHGFRRSCRILPYLPQIAGDIRRRGRAAARRICLPRGGTAPRRQCRRPSATRDKAADHRDQPERAVMRQRATAMRAERRHRHLQKAHQPRRGAGQPRLDAERRGHRPPAGSARRRSRRTRSARTASRR